MCDVCVALHKSSLTFCFQPFFLFTLATQQSPHIISYPTKHNSPLLSVGVNFRCAECRTPYCRWGDRHLSVHKQCNRSRKIQCVSEAEGDELTGQRDSGTLSLQISKLTMHPENGKWGQVLSSLLPCVASFKTLETVSTSKGNVNINKKCTLN
jgi:hypothetical protein